MKRRLAFCLPVLLAACGGGGGDGGDRGYVLSGGLPLAFNASTGAVSMNGTVVHRPTDPAWQVRGNATVSSMEQSSNYAAFARDGVLFANVVRTNAGVGFVFGDTDGVTRPDTGGVTFNGNYAGLLVANGTPVSPQVPYYVMGDARVSANFDADTVTGLIRNRTTHGIAFVNGVRPSGTSGDIAFTATLRENGEFRTNILGPNIQLGDMLFGGGQAGGTVRGIAGDDGVAGAVNFEVVQILPVTGTGRRFQETGVFVAN